MILVFGILLFRVKSANGFALLVLLYCLRPLPKRKAKMTPQEIERTLEFIVEHQAQTAAHLERLAERQGEMQSMFVLMTDLARVQSTRLDQHDETFRAMQLWHRDALARLDQILNRLT
jgi:hypothetical protein